MPIAWIRPTWTILWKTGLFLIHRKSLAADGHSFHVERLVRADTWVSGERAIPSARGLAVVHSAGPAAFHRRSVRTRGWDRHNNYYDRPDTRFDPNFPSQDCLNHDSLESHDCPD